MPVSKKNIRAKHPLFRLIPRRFRCVACGGSGRNSKGQTCVPCNGSGRKQVGTQS